MKNKTVFWLAHRSTGLPLTPLKGGELFSLPFLPSFRDVDMTGEPPHQLCTGTFYNLLPERSPLVTVEGIFVYYLNSCPSSDYLFYYNFTLVLLLDTQFTKVLGVLFGKLTPKAQRQK